MKQFLKKYLGVEFNYKKFQKTTPTHLDQHTERQTLIQMTDAAKTPKSSTKSKLGKKNSDMHK